MDCNVTLDTTYTVISVTTYTVISVTDLSVQEAVEEGNDEALERGEEVGGKRPDSKLHGLLVRLDHHQEIRDTQ